MLIWFSVSEIVEADAGPYKDGNSNVELENEIVQQAPVLENSLTKEAEVCLENNGTIEAVPIENNVGKQSQLEASEAKETAVRVLKADNVEQEIRVLKTGILPAGTSPLLPVTRND